MSSRGKAGFSAGSWRFWRTRSGSGILIPEYNTSEFSIDILIAHWNLLSKAQNLLWLWQCITLGCYKQRKYPQRIHWYCIFLPASFQLQRTSCSWNTSQTCPHFCRENPFPHNLTNTYNTPKFALKYTRSSWADYAYLTTRLWPICPLYPRQIPWIRRVLLNQRKQGKLEHFKGLLYGESPDFLCISLLLSILWRKSSQISRKGTGFWPESGILGFGCR